jgi:hypothetical protein
MIDDIGLAYGILGLSKLSQLKQAVTEVSPGYKSGLLFAALKENSAGIFPGLSLNVDNSKALLQHVVIKVWIESQSLDVALLRVEQVIVKVESMASQNPCLDMILLLRQKFV